jgi:hypothetical protein
MTSLKKLAILPQGKMDVKDARGDEVIDEATGENWSITVHSPGTKEYQKALHAYETARSDVTIAAMKGDTKRGVEDDLKHTADFLAAVTVSFNGFDYEGRKGHEAYKAAYMDLEIGHVAKDLNRFLGDRGNFLPPKVSASNDTSDTQLG